MAFITLGRQLVPREPHSHPLQGSLDPRPLPDIADMEKKAMDDASHDEYADVASTPPPPPVDFSEAEVVAIYRKIDLRCALLILSSSRSRQPLQNPPNRNADVPFVVHGPR